MTEYLDFETQLNDGSRKTEIVEVRARRNRAMLGTISWYAPWRQYAFRPWPDTLYNPDCLRTIAEVCAKMTSDHRALLAERRRG